MNETLESLKQNEHEYDADDDSIDERLWVDGGQRLE